MRILLKRLSRVVTSRARLPLAGMSLVIGLIAACIVFMGSPLPAAAAPGPVTGTSCAPGCDLYAMTGTLTLPAAATAPIWGYSASNTPGSATLPGPVLIATAGTAITITLHNVNLPSATSLSISGQPMIPDTTGVTAGNSKTYSIAAGALRAGTYLYEAGLTADGPRQVAMGLQGALIVRPAGAPLQAYADASTTFADEAVLVLSEVDPAFNAAPLTYDLNSLAPKYWLINGKSYSNTATISTTASSKVLLRYVNAGLQHHSMALAGLHQTIIATDAFTATYTMTVVAQTVPAGGTLDTIVTMPASPPANAKYALFDAAMHLDNNGVRSTTAGTSPIAFGGMLTFLTVAGASTPAGPVTSGVSLAPNPTNGSVPVTLSATETAVTGTVAAAEYFIDTLGANGAGTAMAGAFGGATASVSATLSTAQLAALSSGNHTFYVHGRDSTGTWGAAASAVLNLDKTGPGVSSMSLTPNPTNGTADVQVQATGSDVATGNQNVTAAEYFIDSQPASTVRGTTITIALPATSVSLNTTIISTTVNALSQGNHTIAVRGQDALGNWGAFGTIALTVDKTGPGASGVSATPNPNNGLLGVQIGTGGTFYERIDATLTDALSGGVNSNIVAGEYFLDVVGANGSGGAMIPTDGGYNSSSEAAYGPVELVNITILSQGTHTIYVHGKDAAGNWGATSTTTLLIDKTAPTFTGITLAPNPTLGAANVTLSLIGATDTGGAGVGGGEYWICTGTGPCPAPAIGGGTAFTGPTATIPTGSLAVGSYTVGARIRDAAFNWSANTASATLNVTPPDAIFSNGFETATGTTRPWGWSSASTNTTSRLNVTAAAAQIGALGLQAQGNNTNYVQFNFGTTANPASATFDARFYFNPNGNTGTNQDIFVARTTGGTTVFRVRYRMNAGQSQVQIQVGTGTGNTTWTNITNGASNRIEVVWQSGTSLQLYVNGVLSQTLIPGANSVGQFRLGSVTSGGIATATLEYFDAFAAKRSVSPLIGP